MQLSELHFYLVNLAPPARRDRDRVLEGERLFAEAGCAVCHRPQLKAGAQVIEPYTDLLLHDMGDGLADGREDFLATGTEWRTPPLWGVGLIERINPGAGYLHDGRARSLSEAVLWHGGEAGVARERFAGMDKADRQALLLFLQSL